MTKHCNSNGYNKKTSSRSARKVSKHDGISLIVIRWRKDTKKINTK